MSKRFVMSQAKEDNKILDFGSLKELIGTSTNSRFPAPNINEWGNVTHFDPVKDEQSLFFSAKQEPYNMAQLAKWLDYASLKPSALYKKLSDSPGLIEAVFKDQEKVVFYRIREEKEIKSKVYVPLAIKQIIVSFYAQPAIIPCIFPIIPRTIGPSWIYELRWRIHDGESMKDENHPFRELDQKRLAEWKAQGKDLCEFRYLGCSPRVYWDPWHC